MPAEPIKSGNAVVYTHTANMLYSYLDKIGLELVYELGKEGIDAVPVPTDVLFMPC